MPWNYRIMRHQNPSGETFALHEVYYDDDGKPMSWTEEPETGHWDCVEELIRAHELMLADARKGQVELLDYAEPGNATPAES